MRLQHLPPHLDTSDICLGNCSALVLLASGSRQTLLRLRFSNPGLPPLNIQHLPRIIFIGRQHDGVRCSNMILALFFANSRSEPSDRVIFSLSVSRHTCHSDFFDIEKCCIKSLSRNEIKSIFETCNHWPTVCTRQPGLSSRHKTAGICLIFDWRGGRGLSAVITLSGHFMQPTKRR